MTFKRFIRNIGPLMQKGQNYSFLNKDPYMKAHIQDYSRVS